MTYRHHVFFCLNERAAPEACCARSGAAALQAYAKERVKQLGLAGPDGIRINKAGCLGRCEAAPCLVVYPSATWYSYVDQADIDEIIESHLMGGQVVERLRLP